MSQRQRETELVIVIGETEQFVVEGRPLEAPERGQIGPSRNPDFVSGQGFLDHRHQRMLVKISIQDFEVVGKSWIVPSAMRNVKNRRRTVPVHTVKIGVDEELHPAHESGTYLSRGLASQDTIYRLVRAAR